MRKINTENGGEMMSKTLQRIVALSLACLISAAILAVTFAVYGSVLDFINSTYESKQNSAYADAIHDAREYIYGTSWFVWFIVFLPITSFLYSKFHINTNAKKQLWALIYTLSQSVTYLAVALICGDKLTYGAALIVPVWCFIWAQVGLCRRPLLLRKLLITAGAYGAFMLLNAWVDSLGNDWGVIPAVLMAYAALFAVSSILFSLFAAGNGPMRFLYAMICPMVLGSSVLYYESIVYYESVFFIYFGISYSIGMLGLIRRSANDGQNSKRIRKIFIYRSSSSSPYLNLAIEEYLTRHNPRGVLTLFLWQNAPSVVIGKNQNSRAECRAESLHRDGARLVRRMSGGGAVWHDGGNLCFSFIAHEKNYDVARQLSVIKEACRSLGIDAEPDGRNDILASGAKFSGNAFYKVGENHCHHGTLLVSSDLGRLSKYLTVDAGKLKAKGIESVRSRVINLSELCSGLTVDRLSDRMISAAGRLYGAELLLCVIPSNSEIDARAAFFASNEWIFGEDPEHYNEVSGRFAWGGVNICYTVSKGHIVSCRAYTDSLDTAFSDAIESALVGVEFTSDAIEKAVREIPNGGDVASLFEPS